MKACPVCHHEYADTEHFCPRDGGRLVASVPPKPAPPPPPKTPPPPPSTARLIIESDHGEKREHTLEEGVVSIGAASDNAIVIGGSTVSRHHAKVKSKGGYYAIIDNQSTNGVIVNEKRIGIGEHPLRSGDQILIGRTRLTFEISEVRPLSRPERTTTESLDPIPPEPPVAPPRGTPEPVRSSQPRSGSAYQVKSTGELEASAVPAGGAAVEPAVSSAGLALDGRYELEALLGRDSLGALYRARRVALGDKVAVRILRPSLINDKQAIERFRRQAQVAARIHHPNAVQVYDFVTSSEGAVYVVEELLTGRTLRDLIRAERGLSLHRVVSILNQICGAVHAAHLNGIVLRDLKPESIHIEPSAGGQEIVKVAGTGLARLEPAVAGGVTMAGLVSATGTAQYMSPELWMNRPLDSRADVYSLGIILFEMLTGSVPFNAPTRQETAQLHVSSPAPDIADYGRPDLDESVGAVVSRALAKDPVHRQPTALDLASEFEAAADVKGGFFGNVIQKATGLLPVKPVIIPQAPAPVAAGEAYFPTVVARVEEKGQGAFSAVVVALMAEAFLSRVSGGLVKTAVPLYGLLVFGLDVTSVMGLVLIQNTVPLLLRPLFGSLADKYGKKRIFMMSLIMRTVVSLLFAVANLPLLFIASAARGIADSAKGPSASAMIADHTDEKNIAKAYSWYTTTKSTSGSIGEAFAIWLLTFLLAFFITANTVSARVAILEDQSRPSGEIEQILTPDQPVPATDASAKRLIRIEERQIKLSEVPLADLPNLVDKAALKRTVIYIFLISTFLSAMSVILVGIFIKEKKKKDKSKQKKVEESVEREAVGQSEEKAPSTWAYALLGTILTAPGYMVSGEFFLVLAVKLAVTAKALWLIKLFAEMFIPLFFGPFFGWVADRIGAGKVIAFRSILNIITSVIFWTTSMFTGSALFGTLLGLARGLDEIGKAAFKPTWGAVAAKVSSFKLANRSRTMGILELGVDSSDLIFPQVAGLIFQKFGLPILMVIRGVIAVGAEVYAVLIRRKYGL